MLAVGVPIAAYVGPMVIAEPGMVPQAAASPKPGQPGGNHSKPGDNKKKKKKEDKKQSRDSSSSKDGDAERDSSSERDSGSGSDFADQTNANNRWTPDGNGRSVNTGTPSEADPPQQPEQPVYDGQPDNSSQYTPDQSPVDEQPPTDTESPQDSQQPPPTIVIPRDEDYQPGEQTTISVPPSTQPNDSTDPVTGLIVGLAGASAGALRSRSSSRSGGSQSGNTQGVRGGFSITHIGQADGDQTLVTLNDPDSPTTYNFDTSKVTPEGGSLRLNSDGSVSILNPDGADTGNAFSAPWARDAVGVDQPTQFSVDGTTLTQTIQPRPDAIYPISADPDLTAEDLQEASARAVMSAMDRVEAAQRAIDNAAAEAYMHGPGAPADVDALTKNLADALHAFSQIPLLNIDQDSVHDTPTGFTFNFADADGASHQATAVYDGDNLRINILGSTTNYLYSGGEFTAFNQDVGFATPADAEGLNVVLALTGVPGITRAAAMGVSRLAASVSGTAARTAATEVTAESVMTAAIAAARQQAAAAGNTLAQIQANRAMGNAARDFLIRTMFPGAKAEKYFDTPLGARFVDIFTQNGMAVESKVGAWSMSTKVQAQIDKDAFLLSSGQVTGVQWLFQTSTLTGKVGPDANIIAALAKAGITWKIV